MLDLLFLFFSATASIKVFIPLFIFQFFCRLRLRETRDIISSSFGKHHH